MDNWGFYWCITIFLLGIYSYKRPRYFYLLFPFASLWVISISPAIDISSIRILLIMFIPFLILINRQKISIPYITLFTVIITYLILYSNIYTLIISDQHFNLQNVIKSPLQQPNIRGFLTATFFLFYVSAIFIPFLINNRFYYFTLLIKYTLISFIIISLFALLQVLTINFTSIFNAFYSFFTKELIQVPGHIVGLRPSPFVYEPRYFGIAMGYSIILVILLRIFPIPNIPKLLKSNMLLLLLILMLILSASTSAIGGFAVGFFFVMIWQLTYRKRNKLKVLFIVFMTIIFFSLILSFNSLIIDRFELYLNIAGLNNGTDELSSNLPTLAFIQWLFDQPYNLFFGVGFGNGAYYAYDYISMSTGSYRTGFFGARFSIIDLVASVGLFGCFLLYSLWFLWIKKIQNKLINIDAGYKNYFMIGLGMVLYLIGNGIINENYHFVWFYFGVLFSFLKNNFQVKE